MLCEPVVLFWIRYGFWSVGTIRFRVAVREPEDVTFRAKFRAT
jgi:hypothetical protein